VAIDFPAAPVIGQEINVAGIIWAWDGVKWTTIGGSSAEYLPLAGGTLTGPVDSTSTFELIDAANFIMGGGVSGDALTTDGASNLSWTRIAGGATISDTPPATPQAGDLWWDSVGGQLYVWFDDGSSQQWVIANNSVDALDAYLPLIGGTLTGPLIGTAATFPVGINTGPLIGTTAVFSGLAKAATPPIPDSSTNLATTAWVSAHPMIGDNRIINGDMRIDQRNNGATGTAAGYTIDRWQLGGTLTGRGTWGRNIGSPVSLASEFPFYLGFGSSSAYTPVAADTLVFQQAIEADMIGDFAWGSSNAKSVTLSFWAYVNVGGSYSGAIRNYAGTQSYPFSFTLPVNVWTKVIINIPGATVGTWSMTGNVGALWLAFNLGCGANFLGPAGAWATANYLGAIGGINVVGTTTGVFFVTGVKLETGTVATPFNRYSLAKSLSDCQRYYQILDNIITDSYGATGSAIYASFPFPTRMRAQPTATITIPTYNNAQGLGINATQPSSLMTLANIVTTGPGWAIGTFALNAEL
jgi:hypothetical protein